MNISGQSSDSTFTTGVTTDVLTDLGETVEIKLTSDTIDLQATNVLINGAPISGTGGVQNPLTGNLDIGTYDITGPLGLSLKNIYSTQVLQTSVIDDTANKVLNITSAVINETTMVGTLIVPNIQTNVISDTATQESNINMFNGGIFISASNLSFNDRTIVYTPFNNEIEASSFKKTGGTNNQYMMCDGTSLQYSANSGNSNFYLYKSHTNTPALPVDDGFVYYNNSNQTLATFIYISHRTDDSIDIEVFFNNLSQLNDVYLQQKSQSNNFIRYNITAAPTIYATQYIAIPVSVMTSGGLGATSFGVNEPILLSFFTNTIETDTRLSTLETKTVNQTAINGVSTIFTGTSGVIATKFAKPSGGNPLHFWMTDGTTNSNTYALNSDLINTNSDITTLQSKTQNLTSTTTTNTFTGTGGIVADKFVTNLGTSLGFVKGDGSLDTTGYTTLSTTNALVNLVNPLIVKTQYQSIVASDTSFGTGLRLNGPITTNGASNIDIMSMDKPFIGIQYVHNSGSLSTQSNSLWTYSVFTSAVSATYALTNNVTRQLCSSLWTTTALADGAVCGCGSSATTGAQVSTGFPFGLLFVGNIADTAYNSNNCQNFFGLWNGAPTPTLNQTSQISARLNYIGFASNTTDANICIYSASATSGSTTKHVDLGGYFPANRPAGSVSTDWLKLCLYWDGTTMYYKAVNTSLPESIVQATVTGSFTPLSTQIPATTLSLFPQCVRIMGTPQSNGQAKLIVKRFGVF